MFSDTTPTIRPRLRRLLTGCLAVGVAVTACSDGGTVESPAPGATNPTPSDDQVRSPNGTTMGAPPLNAGTPP